MSETEVAENQSCDGESFIIYIINSLFALKNLIIIKVFCYCKCFQSLILQWN